MSILKAIGILSLIVAALGCSKDDNPAIKEMNLLSITVNGSTLTDGAQNIPTNVVISLSFSNSLDPNAFESQLSLISSNGIESPNIVYSNNASKATLSLMLNPATTYTLKLNAAIIGAGGLRLKDAINISFTTQGNGMITDLPPCTSAPQCLQSVLLRGTLGSGKFEFYSNYPIYEENAAWANLTQAVIVVHGASVNPEDYYAYLTNTLDALSLSESTVLIAPFFRESPASISNDFYWSNLGFRDGNESSNPNKISSFQVVDSLIARLADKVHFPVLKHIILTGQSTGGRFTHVFAPSNRSEAHFPDIRFDYIVCESQYFYYPDGQRINENTNQLYTPASCSGYDIWPFGYHIVPSYLNGTSEADFNQQFVNRNIIYVLGNGTGADGSLNTTDCSATLLGSSRYLRGENMFRYMELVYPGVHQHSKVVVPGVTHDGSVIYQSPEFRTLLMDLLN